MRKADNPLAIKALEIVEDDLKDAENQAIKKVLRAISSGEFTPEMGVQKWHEIYALRLVPVRLKRQASRGAKRAEEKPVDTL